MRILLTGGAGYIGSHTLVELLANKYKFCVVDNLSNSNIEFISRVQNITKKEFKFNLVDICDHNALSKVFESFRPEIVIHFAGSKSVKESFDNPLKYYKNNVFGSINLLNVMDKYSCSKIIFSSSATVYGNPEYLPIDENHKVSPSNPYGHSKLMVEKIIKDWSTTYNNKSCILRYFNPIGAHESGLIGEHSHDHPNNLLPIIENVFIGKENNLKIYGNNYKTPDGSGIRDYIHVVDLAKSHVAGIKFFDGTKSSDVFNIGTGKGNSVFEIVSIYEKVAKKNIPYVVEGRRKGDISESVADPSKARAKLSWKAELTIEDAIKHSVNWKLKNPNGYNN